MSATLRVWCCPTAGQVSGLPSRQGERGTDAGRESVDARRARDPAILKNFPATLEAIATERGIAASGVEVWFGDKARIGQKNKITRRWAKRGSRPSAPHDQRTASTSIFGAICPQEGKAVGLILPWCNTEAMNLQLAEISVEVATGRHAALLVDQAGWHLSAGLDVPANITIVPLPAKCPELNPHENVWQFMRDNWLSNHVFAGYENLADHCCYAWNKLADQPGSSCRSDCVTGHTGTDQRVLGITVIRRRSPFRTFYDQLIARGRPKKVALVAVMRKLLTILNAILRDRTPWRSETA